MSSSFGALRDFRRARRSRGEKRDRRAGCEREQNGRQRSRAGRDGVHDVRTSRKMEVK
jgi:hypothetical protein